VDRTMTWQSAGMHGETAILAPGTRWYFAEGATHSDFNLFYLLQNPGATAATIEIAFLLPGGVPPIVQTYTVAPRSRLTVWVNQIPGLESTDVAGIVTSTNDTAIVAERAMYRTVGDRPFKAGHASAGVAAPATEWFLAEGATGDFFDAFVLVVNPSPIAAELTVDFQLPDGGVVTRSYAAPALSRLSIWVDSVDPLLAHTSAAFRVRSVNNVPVVVERSMWWPGPVVSSTWWYEGHASAGFTQTASRWALAEGEDGGARQCQTYVLVANQGSPAGQVEVTLLFEDGGRVVRTFDIPAHGRITIDAGASFPEARHRRFGIIVESVGVPLPLVVERSMYMSMDGMLWSAGAVSAATPIP
jgi:hypothetical protein